MRRGGSHRHGTRRSRAEAERRGGGLPRGGAGQASAGSAGEQGVVPGGTAGRGTLFVVGTPIGNLDDLSPRAVETLRRCALVACEDTRVTRALLHRHGIAARVISCHRFNEPAQTARIIGVLDGGGDVALASDGGTPGLSDPGALVVRAVRAAGAKVSPIPGPSAATALWSVSGFPSGPFIVVGFLPQRRGDRRRALEALRQETRPLLIFESPHRILEMLADAVEVLGDRECCLGREMTKLHEEILGGRLGELRAALAGGTVRGEFSLVVAGQDPGARGSRTVSGATEGTSGDGEPTPERLRAAADDVHRLVAEGMDKGAALRRVARASGLPHRAIYGQIVRDRDAVTGGPGDEEEE